MSLDITQLLNEVEAEIKTLLKSAQEDADNLKTKESKQEDSKEEESKQEDSKKEESKQEDSKKEELAMEKAGHEGSGYENQAPEVANDDKATPAEQSENINDTEDIASMLKDLDDDMVHELYQRIKMELMSRMQTKDESTDSSSQASATPEVANDSEQQMSVSKSEKDYTDRLVKAEYHLKSKETEIVKLKKTIEEYEKGIGEFADLVKVLVERPIVRAATDIQFISKDGDLNKSECNISDVELKKAVDVLSADRKKLASLSKSELDVIADFYSGKNVKDKIIKVINK